MSRRIRSLAWVLLLAVLWPLPAQAYVGLCCGRCGGNMPMNIPGGGIPQTHEFRFKAQVMHMKMDGLRDGTSRVRESDLLAPGKFMAVPTEMDMTMLHFSGAYSFTDDFVVMLMGMWKKNRMDMDFNAMMSGMTGRSGFTMESEGLGDTMLMAKYRLWADDPLIPTGQVSLLAGLSVPTGSISEDNEDHPVDSRRDEKLPYGMQLGSGTWDPTFGVLYQGSSSPWWWGANFTYTGRWHENHRDYRLGDRVGLDLYAMYQLRYDLVAQVQINAWDQDRIHGEMDSAEDGDSGHMMPGNPASPYVSPLWDPHNYGGREVFATLGLQWQPIPLHILDLQVSLPLHRDLNGPQLETDYRVMFTWYIELPTRRSKRFSKRKPEKSGLGF